MSDKQVTLHAFETDYIRELHHWLNDSVSISMVGRTPLTYEQTVNHVEKNVRTEIFY